MSSDGSSRIVQVALPGWLRALKPVVGVLVRFGKNPVTFVFSIISLYLSSLFLDLFGLVSAVVLGIFDSFAYVFDLARLFLVGSFGALGAEVLGIPVAIGAALNRVLLALGPAAPFVVAIVGSVVIYGTYRVTIALLGEVPIGSSIVDILGLR